MKKQSEKGKVIKEIDKLFRQYLLKTRPHICEWCRRSGKELYVSHILPKGTYPKLRFADRNVLLLCYYCHMIKWHRNPAKAHEFMVMLQGKNYKEELLFLNKIQQKHTMFYLKALKKWFEERKKETKE